MRFRLFLTSFVGVVVAAVVIVSLTVSSSGQSAVMVDADDIGGVVTSSTGPEAGVWVIAETNDLETTFTRIVATDGQGRYLVPDLPSANYDLWVRGYGLVDSPKIQSSPGETHNLTAVVAPNEEAAAQYYPANYWYSLLEVPGRDEFPGTGFDGNGISPTVGSQAEWLRIVKTDGCESCHQIGNKTMRTITPALGTFDSTVEAWDRRVQSGQAGAGMSNRLSSIGRSRALEMFADWTDRIAAGELPTEAPPRPQGVERNIVITQWDWADPKAYLHDEVSSDKRNPRVNAYGPLYGALEASADYLSVLDPENHTTDQILVPVRAEDTPYAAPREMPEPSQFWGDELIWDSKANVHNPMMDHKGRVWFTSKVRDRDNPAVCKAGSDHPSAQLFPLEESGRHLAMYDPETDEVTLIGTCYGTHHLFFAEDENNTLWTSSGGGGGAVGWLNTNMFDATGDEVASQGWAPLILDTNGNGRQDAWVEPDEPLDPTKDKRFARAFYGVMPNPADNTIWGSYIGFPGGLIRLDPGDNPPATAIAEVYDVPWDNPAAPVQGYSPRGMDVDRNGVVWTVLASGHMASFDRSKCTGPLNGPTTAEGQHCPEGWTLYQSPGPQMKGVTDSGSADSHYYNWVDMFNTFGLGENVPIATGSGSDSLLALVDAESSDDEWVILRVPYPLGFFSKGMDGRIDDPNGGWKGRGLWTTWATRTPYHSELGKGMPSKVVKMQLRPDPLAR